jgi:hypothetical protein
MSLTEAQRHTIATARPDGHRWRVDTRSFHEERRNARLIWAVGISHYVSPLGHAAGERIPVRDHGGNPSRSLVSTATAGSTLMPISVLR